MERCRTLSLGRLLVNLSLFPVGSYEGLGPHGAPVVGLESPFSLKTLSRATGYSCYLAAFLFY